MNDFAIWESPDATVRVAYPLPLFHEIDLDVSEGYRRIPRGGIEIGGLLFGHVQGATVQIEATRPIECEHLLGPSFKLSEKDLSGVAAQIIAASKDAELSRLEAVGWFIAHTRSDLLLTDTELAQFNDLFPGSMRLTLLVRPEKFKPTRFAFLVRRPSGDVPLNGVPLAFILPLPGRASGAHQPVRAPQPIPEVIPEHSPEPVIAPPPAQPRSESLPMTPPLSASFRSTVPIPPAPKREPKPEPEARPVSEPPPPATPRVAVPVPEPVHTVQPGVPEPSRRDPEPEHFHSRAVLRDGTSPRRHRALILLIAALLGCALGYLLYRQIPPAVIPITVTPAGGGFVVTWPAEQTRGSDSVLMRINDGEPMPVPLSDREVGRTQIPATNARVLKLEIIARHQLGDSRGIVEYLR